MDKDRALNIMLKRFLHLIGIYDLSTTTSGLNYKLLEMLYDKADKVIRDESLFLIQDLSLEKLAQKVGTNRSYLSKAISIKCENFTQFINRYRVNYAYQKLVYHLNRREKIQLIDLAFLSGFKSVRSMNKSFERQGKVKPGTIIMNYF